MCNKCRKLGIVESKFRHGSVTYRMFDVGGQRSERKKWYKKKYYLQHISHSIGITHIFTGYTVLKMLPLFYLWPL